MENVGVNMERWKTHTPVFNHGFEDQQKAIGVVRDTPGRREPQALGSPWPGHSSVDGIRMGASVMKKMRNAVVMGSKRPVQKATTLRTRPPRTTTQRVAKRVSSGRVWAGFTRTTN